MFYGFYLNMWIMNRLTEDQLTIAVAKGFVTEEEKQMIMVTPQVPKA